MKPCLQVIVHYVVLTEACSSAQCPEFSNSPLAPVCTHQGADSYHIRE